MCHPLLLLEQLTFAIVLNVATILQYIIIHHTNTVRPLLISISTYCQISLLHLYFE